MSFRSNNKREREERLRWSAFCEANHALIEGSGLTTPTIETQERFEDLLMHGWIDHHDDWSKFNVRDLEPEPRRAFVLLVDKDFEAGYFDPGLSALGWDDAKRLALKYPQQFSTISVQMAREVEEEET